MPKEAHHSLEVWQGLFGRQPLKIDEDIRPLRVTSTARGMNQSHLSMRFPAPVCRIIRPLPRGSRVQTTSPRWPWPGPGVPISSFCAEGLPPSGPSAADKDAPEPCASILRFTLPVRAPNMSCMPALQEWPIDAQDLFPLSQRQITQSEAFKGTRRRLREQACILDSGCAQSL